MFLSLYTVYFVVCGECIHYMLTYSCTSILGSRVREDLRAAVKH